MRRIDGIREDRSSRRMTREFILEEGLSESVAFKPRGKYVRSVRTIPSHFDALEDISQ